MLNYNRWGNTSCLQKALRQNSVLRHVDAELWPVLMAQLCVQWYKKGYTLIEQGDWAVYQNFVINGVVKASMMSEDGREVVLCLFADHETDAAYAAWRLELPSTYTLKTVTPALVAKLPMQKWAQILQRSAHLKCQFEADVMRIIDEVTLHYSQLHLYDAQERLDRLKRRNPAFLRRIPKRLLSAYLNMTPETLYRLQHREPEALLDGPANN